MNKKYKLITPKFCHIIFCMFNFVFPVHICFVFTVDWSVNAELKLENLDPVFVTHYLYFLFFYLNNFCNNFFNISTIPSKCKSTTFLSFCCRCAKKLKHITKGCGRVWCYFYSQQFSVQLKALYDAVSRSKWALIRHIFQGFAHLKKILHEKYKQNPKLS